LAIAVVSGAYMADIIRSGIGSVDATQIGSVRLDGGTYRQAMRLVVLPQALPRVIPR
jgi:ABC-type amino acid transport system permease subunit